jgi:hypothetical protein
MDEKSLKELKHSRPPGAGWEWYKADAEGTDFRWYFQNKRTGRIHLIGIGLDLSFSATVKDSEGKLLYVVDFVHNKDAMLEWAQEVGKSASRTGQLQTAPKYYARPIETIKSSPGCWDTFNIGVFRRNEDGDELVGSYNRNYQFMSTFCWFTKDGKDYALYSKDYTATRVMEPPSCKDLGGEESVGHGFCPVDFYVPSFVDKEIVDKNPKFNGAKFRIYDPSPGDLTDREGSKSVSPLMHSSFGFLCGCVWGDDTSWKIQYLDLSQVDKGILKRDDRFGYIELPPHLDLREAIDMGDGECNIRIAHDDWFDPKTGKKSE